MIRTEQTEQRLGNRAEIAQPAELRIDEQVIRGSIENIGLSGAFFNTSELPPRGTNGVLVADGSQGVEVRVVWQREGNAPGVGLAFDSNAFRG